METQEIVVKKQLAEKTIGECLVMLMADTGQDIKTVEITCWSFITTGKKFRATVKIIMEI